MDTPRVGSVIEVYVERIVPGTDEKLFLTIQHPQALNRPTLIWTGSSDTLQVGSVIEVYVEGVDLCVDGKSLLTIQYPQVLNHPTLIWIGAVTQREQSHG